MGDDHPEAEWRQSETTMELTMVPVLTAISRRDQPMVVDVCGCGVVVDGAVRGLNGRTLSRLVPLFEEVFGRLVAGCDSRLRVEAAAEYQQADADNGHSFRSADLD